MGSICHWFYCQESASYGSCDAYKAYLIPEAPSQTDIYISCKSRRSTVHSLTYPPENLVKTVGTAVTLLEGVI